MSDTIRNMAASKATPTRFIPKSASGAPMIADSTYMRKGYSKAIFPRGCLVPHDEGINKGNLRNNINPHEKLALKISLDGEAIELIVDLFIDILLAKMSYVVKSKTTNEELKSSADCLNTSVAKIFHIKEFKHNFVRRKQDRDIVMTC